MSNPVVDASAWKGRDFTADRSWVVHLDGRQLGEIADALASCRKSGLPYHRVTASTFPVPSLEATLEDVGAELRNGRGFVLLKGLPVQDYSDDEARLIFWGLSSHLGVAVTQNSSGQLIGDVRDEGVTPGDPNRRSYAHRGGGIFHVDLADVVGLLCLRKAMTGGLSTIVSSTSVYNCILQERPDLLEVLKRGFHWDRRKEQHPDEPEMTTARIPVFSDRDGVVSCRYNRPFFTIAANRSGIPLTELETEALDFMDDVIKRPDLHMNMDFEPGDMQFLSNYTVLHSRSAYEDYPEPHRKRHLLRVWLLVNDFRPVADEDTIRFGVLRYGNLGLNADEAAASGLIAG